MDEAHTATDALTGCLLGTAVGDALGLPREGLRRGRALRLFGDAPLRHRFLFGHGMISDDTDHACFVAQALLAAEGDPQRFARALAWHLRWWLVGLPAGVGLATLRGIIKLWLGWPPHRSGVFSAGNGPAMRAPLIGAYAAEDESLLRDLVRASTRLTHTDPRAEEGALLIALAARHGRRHGPAPETPAFLLSADEYVTDDGLRKHIEAIPGHLARRATAQEFARALKLEDGVTGFVTHTVPVALYCWLRYPTDFRRAVEEVILLGGDTDTTGAIVGGLMGVTLGASAIPDEWLSGLWEWPRSVNWMRRLTERLASGASLPLPLPWPGLLLRNPLFALAVIFHGFRRLAPPY